MAKWGGLYTHGEKVVLRYTVRDAVVLELPGCETRGPAPGAVFTRTFRIGKTSAPLVLLIADVPGGAGKAEGTIARMTVRKIPPGRRSISQSTVDQGRGVNHFTTCSGRVQAA